MVPSAERAASMSASTFSRSVSSGSSMSSSFIDCTIPIRTSTRLAPLHPASAAAAGLHRRYKVGRQMLPALRPGWRHPVASILVALVPFALAPVAVASVTAVGHTGTVQRRSHSRREEQPEAPRGPGVDAEQLDGLSERGRRWASTMAGARQDGITVAHADSWAAISEPLAGSIGNGGPDR